MKRLLCLCFCLLPVLGLAQTATPPASLSNWPTTNTAISVPDPTTTGQGMVWDNTNHKWTSGSVGSGTGTVTSVALSGGTTGLTVTGSPITTSGTFTLAGTVAIANGGTGAATAGAHNFFGNNTGGTAAPAFVQPAFSDLSGNIATSQMNSGTGASSSTFWRGDGAWAAPTDAQISFSDITTGNVSNSQHGFAPKSVNDATKFLNGGTSPGYSQVTFSNLGGNPTAAQLGSGTASSSTFLRGDLTWALPPGGGGSGTVTNTGGNLTANSVVLGAGTTDTKVVAGIVTDGTSALTLGVSGTSVGSVVFNNGTSGSVTLSPPTGALGTVTATLPLGGTLATLAGTETLTNKTLTSPSTSSPTITGDPVGIIFYKRITGVNLNAVATSDVYTVPTGKTATVMGMWQITSAHSGSPTTHSVYKLVESGASAAMIGITTNNATSEAVGDVTFTVAPSTGTAAVTCAAGNKIQVSVSTAGNNTTQTADFIVAILIY